MRKFILGAFFLVLLLGCEPVDGPSNRSLPEEFNKAGEQIHLTVVFHPSLSDLRAAYRDHADDSDEGLLGYSFWKQGADPHVCEIHAVKPAVDADKRMMTLGHELMHCLIGKYHD